MKDVKAQKMNNVNNVVNMDSGRVTNGSLCKGSGYTKDNNAY